jgi:MFS family permease
MTPNRAKIAIKAEKAEKVFLQKDFSPYAWVVLGILLAVRIAHGVN